MWIQTTDGHFSITQSTHTPGMLQIRSRSRAAIEALRSRHTLEVPVIGPQDTGPADYPYRILLEPPAAAALVAAEVGAITYSNFKNAVAAGPDQPYHEALDQVWHTFANYQRTTEGFGPYES